MQTYERIIESAEEALRAKDSVQAMHLYAEAHKAAPDRKEPLVELALLFIAHDDAAGAVEFLERALLLDGVDLFVRLNLGLAYYELGRTEKTVEHLKEAVLLIQYIVASTRIDQMFGLTTDANVRRAVELEETGEQTIELLQEIAGIRTSDASEDSARRLRVAS